MTSSGNMKYTYKKVELDNNKTVEVFDNVFPMRWRDEIYYQLRNSYYKIGWEDDLTGEHSKYDQHMHAKYSIEEVQSLDILRYLSNVSEIHNVITKLKFDTAVVNCSTASDVYLIHTHPSKKVLLYYANPSWSEMFHGETQFWSEDRKEIQYSLPYTPGRIIMFDSSIPHTVRPQSIEAPKFRFTMAIQYT